ncbi:MAG: PAS domain S-box protein [Kiritimatiellae bacterium]|nr:PAS domain S-box protein [Kiritimatiellia bacterium]
MTVKTQTPPSTEKAEKILPSKAIYAQDAEQAPLRVLLVDDEPEFVELLDYVLKKDGYSTMLAHSGREALSLLQKQPADILITDMRMPGINGIELMQYARKDYPWLQAIAVSAHEKPDDAIELMKQGAIDFLQKPISNDELRHAVEAAADKVRLQLSLKKTSQTLARVIASISDAIWSAELNPRHELNFTFMSPVIKNISGRNPDYYLSFRSHCYTIHPEDTKRFESAIVQILEGKTNHCTCEYRIVHADGAIRWVQDDITAERNPSTPTALNGVISDITKRKQTEELLIRGEKFQKAIIDALPDMIFTQDAHGFFDTGHAGDSTPYYCSPEELIGRNAWEAFPHKVAHLMEQARIAATQAGEVTTIEFELPVQGELMYFETRFAPMPPDRTVSIMRNITDRRKTYQALKESEELYRAIVKSSHDAIFIYDGQRIVFANDQFCEMLGYTQREIMKTDMKNLIHPEDQQRLLDISYDYTDACFLSNYVARILHKTQGVIPCAISVSLTTYHNQCAALGTMRMI